MKKICILSPGRCGSNFLFNLLLPRYFDNLQNIVHTHDENKAKELEKEDFEIITLRRRSIFEWILSECAVNCVPGKQLNEISYWKTASLNPITPIYVPGEEYIRRRKQIINQLSLYDLKWKIFYYEDLVDNPFKILSFIFNYPYSISGSEKLKYDKKQLIQNYLELVQFETTLNIVEQYYVAS